jgi:hypothetical protein
MVTGHGSIDGEETRTAAQDILERGQTAFTRRREIIVIDDAPRTLVSVAVSVGD